jgi:cobyrinic acid a,c-diamide synthase
LKGLLIGGTASGVGKTTVTLAILACLRRRGYNVQAFKGGPDFLDTTHHTRISGRVARNLDTWMLSPEANRDVLREASAGAGAVVVEGMMGLFDGKDGVSEAGSSAEIAKLLKLPVVLVIDCARSARSIAAVVLGFESFDPELPLSGVILNGVAGAYHFRLLQSAIQRSCKAPILGWLPREPKIAIPERHLGLHAAVEVASLEDARLLERELDVLAGLAKENFQMEEILQLTCGLEFAASPAGVPKTRTLPTSDPQPVRIGVARDRAFSFYYEDNLDLLRECGAEIVPFSPISDCRLPDRLDALYFGGGYPELHAGPLSRNEEMLSQVRNFAASGKYVYAECGGMLYLAKALHTLEQAVYPMAGVLPLNIRMTEKLVDFGYVTVEFTKDCLLGPKGTSLRGHSFHYSRIHSSSQLPTSYAIRFSLSGKQQEEGFTCGNVLASYVHLHFRANPTAAESFVTTVRKARREVPA